jgi:hypothetical protein
MGIVVSIKKKKKIDKKKDDTKAAHELLSSWVQIPSAYFLPFWKYGIRLRLFRQLSDKNPSYCLDKSDRMKSF